MEAFEGPGKYDAQCAKALLETDAYAVLMVVVGGNKGHGFSVNSRDRSIVLNISTLLREVADEIDKKIEQTTNNERTA